MRGLPRLPDSITTRFERSGKEPGEDAKAGARAPKPAARSQTDQVGVAQFAIGLNRGRPATVNRDRGLILPVHSDGQEDHLRQTFISKGRFLARQDQWDVLGRLVREADAAREITSEGHPAASLMAQGARSDFVQAARAAYAAGETPDEDVMTALDEALEEAPECWGLAAVIAQAHMEMGEASLGDTPLSRPAADTPAMRHHFDRAEAILSEFCPVEHRSVILAEARCRQLLGAADAAERVGADHEVLIDLDPGNPVHMRRYGLQLLPEWYGSLTALDDAAHETAERVEETWGEGGYTWVWLDALSVAPGAAERLDIDRYLEGIEDILQRRGTQHIVNVLAAHAGVAMAPTAAPEDISADARRHRGQIHACFGNIIRGNLHELHPRHWAEARHPGLSRTTTPEALSEKGEAIARCLIARHFSSDLAAGRIVTFSPRGLEVHTPA